VPDWCLTDLLPGLWVTALAVVTVALLGRFYDRIPAAALSVFTLVLAIAFGPVLFGGGLLLPLDSLRGRVPFRELAPTQPHGNPLQGDLIQLVAPAGAATRRAFADGRWPLWNEAAGAGMPLLADPQAQVFEPLVLAALPFGVPQAAGVSAALRVLVALLFTLLLLRRLGLGDGAALFGSLAWGLGGFLSLWLGWPLANSGAWLPAVLYGVVRVTDRGGRRDVLLLAVATFGLLSGGHPETILYSLLLAGALLAVRTAGGRGAGWGGRKKAAAALLLAAGLAAPALVPTFAYLPQTLRAARLSGPIPASPTPTGSVSTGPVSTSPVSTGAVSTGAGPAGAGGAGGWGHAARTARRLVPLVAPNAFGNDRYLHYWGGDNINEDASGFVGTGTLLLVLLGLITPWRREWGWGRRRREETLMLGVAALCLLVVAQAPGVVEVLDHLPGGRASGHHHRLLLPLGFSLVLLAAFELDRRVRGAGGAWAVGAVGIAAALLGGLLAWGYLSFPNPDDPARLAVLRIGWLHWQGRFLLGAALLLAAAGIAAGHRRLARPLPWVLAAAVAGELLLLHLPAHPPAPKRLAFPTPPALAYLIEHHRPGERITGVDFALLPNLAGVYGLEDARLYNPVAPALYLAAAAPVIAGWEGEMAIFTSPEHPFYERLGVRHVLAPPGARLPPPLVRVFEDPSGSVWERPRPRPRLSFVSSAETETSGAASLLSLGEVSPARLSALAECAGPERLLASLYQDGGWRLLVDGRRRTSPRVEGAFVGATVPSGRHRLTLLYRPRGFLAGSLLGALALALGGAWLLPPRSRGG